MLASDLDYSELLTSRTVHGMVLFIIFAPAVGKYLQDAISERLAADVVRSIRYMLGWCSPVAAGLHLLTAWPVPWLWSGIFWAFLPLLAFNCLLAVLRKVRSSIARIAVPKAAVTIAPVQEAVTATLPIVTGNLDPPTARTAAFDGPTRELPLSTLHDPTVPLPLFGSLAGVETQY